MATRRAIGRYELVQRLGHGGMATVYLARATGNAGFEKLVAIKVIHPHLAAEPEFVEMFLDEARIAAKIQHPHVAGILDLGHDDGLHFMVMEYIDGETLSGLLRQLRPRGERLPLPVVVQILIDACEGLTAVHGLRDVDGHPYGLVHRDMSPQNLMIGFDGWIKIVDFGLAKATGKRHTHTGHLRGKLAYMSPEQARGRPLTAATDLFALGVVLWELLTGKRLFAGETDAETLDNVMRCEVPSLAELRPDAPPALVALLRRALAREPEARYPTAEAMLAELRQIARTLGGDEDPRKLLATTMRGLFDEQAKYRQAAVRGSSRAHSRPRMHLVPRTGSAPMPAADDRTRSDTPLALVPPPASESQEEIATVARKHPASDPQPASAASHPQPASAASHPQPADEAPLSMSRTLTNAPVRGVGLWLGLPMLGAVLGVAILLTVFAWREDGGGNPVADVLRPQPPAPAVTPPGPARDPPPPRRIVWNFESEPAGAQVSIAGAPPAVAAEIERQLAGRLTPFSVEVPYDEKTRVEVLFTRPGYKIGRRSLLPISNQNIDVALQPEAPAVPDPVKRKPPSKHNGPTKLSTKPGPAEPQPATSVGEELKDEPNFGTETPKPP
ncbi:MAG: protein kinase [Myxococcales bacterium]|nr:protein kinase [Myxococcales bacterium]